MKAAGVTPDIPTYKPLLSVLWECSHRAKAIELFVEASEAGVYPQGDRKIDLHELSQGRGAGIPDSVAECDGDLNTRRRRWTACHPRGGDGLGQRLPGDSEVKDAVTAFLAGLGLTQEAPSDNPGCLEAEQAAVGEWLGSVNPVVMRVCGDHPPS